MSNFKENRFKALRSHSTSCTVGKDIINSLIEDNNYMLDFRLKIL